MWGMMRNRTFDDIISFELNHLQLYYMGNKNLKILFLLFFLWFLSSKTCFSEIGTILMLWDDFDAYVIELGYFFKWFLPSYCKN